MVKPKSHPVRGPKQAACTAGPYRVKGERKISKYIDADKIKRHGRRGGLVVWQEIEEMPAADVAEIKHGRWVEHIVNNIYCEGGVAIRLTCPVCGECFTVTREARPRERFCRWCGARMDEVEK